MTFDTSKYAIRAARIAEEESRSGTKPGGDDLPADPESIVRNLRDVDLTGGGGRGPFTMNPTGSAVTNNPFGAASKGSLLAAYEAYKAKEAARARVGNGSPIMEGTALLQSKRHVAKKVRKGKSAPEAVASGHAKYREMGGQMSYAAWTRALAK